MLERVYRGLIERRAAMALEMLDSPPQDWSAFQRRLGQYQELAELIAIVAQAMRGEENDQ